MKIGGTRSFPVASPGGKERAVIKARAPRTDEWLQFQGDMAKAVSADNEETTLAMVLYEYGAKLVIGGEDIEVEDESCKDLAEAICRYMPVEVAQIGRHMFMEGGGRELDLGKSDKPSVPSTPASSVPSRGKSASTSSRRSSASGTSSAPIAPVEKLATSNRE